MNFDDVYKGYVIKEVETDMFIGPDSDRYRVKLRSHAARFTKQEALDYLEEGYFLAKNNFGYTTEKNYTYYIEDAT